MMSDETAIAYAREVYAACLTVGFVDDHVAALKQLLDRGDAGRAAEILALATAAQAASVEWAGRTGSRA